MHRALVLVFGGLLALAVAPASGAAPDAPVTIASPRPDKVAVTLYRDPSRSVDQALPPPGDTEEPLGGFAVIRETRIVDLPPGPVTVRFEGVSSSILPETSILRGALARERNFDRRLLSQRGLLDAYTGQTVLRRRTDPATGAVKTDRVRIRSAPDALIVEGADGVEAVSCSGLPETLTFDAVPAGLNPVPTLSMQLGDQPGGRTTLELTYVAGNFDWQANYVGTLSPDAEAIDLFAWLTVASGDATSYVDADMAIVAGRIAYFGPRRAHDDDDEEEDEAAADPWHPDNIAVWTECWPSGSTGAGSARKRAFTPDGWPTQTAGYALGFGGYWYGGGGGGDCGDEDEGCGEIVVTGMRIAPREDIGDYKLYRVPQPTTLAAQSRKQIAFLERPGVAAQLLHIFTVEGSSYNDDDAKLRIDNAREGPLAEPLPGGQVALFQPGAGEPWLVQETDMKDKAVGELIDLRLDTVDDADVDADQEELDSGDDWTRYRLTVENDGEQAEWVEVSFANSEDESIDRISRPTTLRDGKRIWLVRVPPESERHIDYRVREVDPVRIGADNQDDWEEPEEPDDE